jgi:hypothetical protein
MHVDSRGGGGLGWITTITYFTNNITTLPTLPTLPILLPTLPIFLTDITITYFTSIAYITNTYYNRFSGCFNPWITDKDP